MKRKLRLMLEARGFVVVAIMPTSIAMPVSVGSNRTKNRRNTRAVQRAEKLLDRGRNIGLRHRRGGT